MSKKSQQDIDIAFCSEASWSRYQLVCRISNGHKVSNAFLSFNNQPCIFFLREKKLAEMPFTYGPFPKKNEQYVHKS